MSLSFGGSNYSGPTRQGTASSAQILGAINPGLMTAGGFNSEFTDFLKNLDSPVGSILQGLPGVLTFDSNGNAMPVGSDTLPTLLPKLTDIGNYDTLFEKFDAGGLGASGQGLMGTFLNMAQTPMSIADLMKGSGGGGGIGIGVGGGGGISKPGAVEFNAPPNIGELTGKILESMPPEFQTFVGNTLAASSPEALEAEMANFETKMRDKMMADLEGVNEQTLDLFAAQGLGASGAAIEASKELATRALIETNATVATARLTLLQQNIEKMDVATRLVNVLTQAGATEQANLVSGELARMQSETAQNVAYLNGQVALQQSAMQLNAQLQSQLIAGQVSMFNTQMGLLNTGFGGLLSESQNEEIDINNSLMLPYNLLMGTAQQNSQRTKSPSGVDLGGLIGGAAAIAAPFLAPGTSTMGAIGGGTGGGLSVSPGWSI